VWLGGEGMGRCTDSLGFCEVVWATVVWATVVWAGMWQWHNCTNRPLQERCAGKWGAKTSQQRTENLHAHVFLRLRVVAALVDVQALRGSSTSPLACWTGLRCPHTSTASSRRVSARTPALVQPVRHAQVPIATEQDEARQSPEWVFQSRPAFVSILLSFLVQACMLSSRFVVCSYGYDPLGLSKKPADFAK